MPSDTVCNTVYVVADVFDDGHCILEGNAESCVFVAKPDVEVDKSGPEVAVGGEKIDLHHNHHEHRQCGPQRPRAGCLATVVDKVYPSSKGRHRVTTYSY